MNRCPACGTGELFHSYLEFNDKCPHCREELHHHRIHSIPCFVTFFLIGHLLIPLALMVEKLFEPQLWVHFALWVPLTIILGLVLLPRVKGAMLSLQWAFCMHGFEYSALCDPAKPRKN